MTWLWTHGGVSFGYRIGDRLFTHEGIEAGRFHENEVYAKDGRYLGELMHDRLIRNRSKTRLVRGPFAPEQGGSYAPDADCAGYFMYAGFEDFPRPEAFR